MPIERDYLDYTGLTANATTIVLSVSALFYAAKRLFYDRKLDVRRAWIWHLAKGQTNVPPGFVLFVVVGFWRPLRKALVKSNANIDASDSSLADFYFDYREMVMAADWLDRITDRHDVITGNDDDEYFLDLLRLWVTEREENADDPSPFSTFLHNFSSKVEEKPYWFTIKAKYAPKPATYTKNINEHAKAITLKNSLLPWKTVHEALQVISYFYRRLEAPVGVSGQDWRTKPEYFVLLGHLCDLSPEDARTCVSWMAYASCFFKLDLPEVSTEDNVIQIQKASEVQPSQFAAKTYQTKLRAICSHYKNDDNNSWCLLAKILLEEENNASLFSKLDSFMQANPNNERVLAELYDALANQIAPGGMTPEDSNMVIMWTNAKLLCAEQVYYSAHVPVGYSEPSSTTGTAGVSPGDRHVAVNTTGGE